MRKPYALAVAGVAGILVGVIGIGLALLYFGAVSAGPPSVVAVMISVALVILVAGASALGLYRLIRRPGS